MKKFFLAILFLFVAVFSFGQTKIDVDSVQQYVGQQVTVCTNVSGVKALEKMTFINLKNPYPQSPLTIVIFTKDIANFSTAPATLYEGKNICVTGTIIEYKGKLEIVVTKPEEIAIQ
jgi:DNA/RNA endonuclease YhcR with UshA esterase domain